MTDMTAFEQQVADEMLYRSGPIRPVDDLAVFDAVITASRSTRWGFTMFSALRFVVAAAIVALFGGFLLASVLTTPQTDELAPGAVTESSAAEFTGEMLFELAAPGRALPEEPSALETGGWRLDAGTDVTGERQASQANESMRNRAFMVTSGTFLIEPTTDALLWRAPGSAPEVTLAGEAVTLMPGEAIYLPAVPAEEVDAERYLRVANPGTEDATGLTFHVHEGSTGVPFGGFPPGLHWRTWSGSLSALPDVNEWTAADEVLFRLTRHSGDPGATFESSAAPALAEHLVESGAVERTVSGPGGEYIEVYGPGAKPSRPVVEGVEETFTVVGDEPASLLELVVIPRSSTSE